MTSGFSRSPWAGILVILAVVAVSIDSPGFGQAVSPAQAAADWRAQLESALKSRLGTIQARKIKTRGKPKRARWEDVDKTLAEAVKSLDLSSLLDLVPVELTSPAAGDRGQALRSDLDALLVRHGLSYRQMFILEDPETFFPLTNSVLRLSDDNSLVDRQIFSDTGFSLGRYISKYVYEKTGGLSTGAGSYRLTFFQYRDNEGEVRPSGNINLLDTYSVRWKEIQDQRGLLLTAEMLLKSAN